MHTRVQHEKQHVPESIALPISLGGEMRVSIVIPCYNSSRTIRTCVESVLRQRIEDYEVVVVDDASTDESLHVLKEYSRVKIVSMIENRGPSYARNAGVQASSGEILIFLDSDCFVEDPDWATRHAERLLAGSSQRILGGSVNADGPGWIGRSFTYNNWYVCHPRLRSIPWGVRHLQSTNLSMYRIAFEDLGGFDESLRAGEDVEFCVRSARKGYALTYCGDIQVRHDNRSSFRDFMRINFDYGKTRVVMKHKGVYGKWGFLIQENPFFNVVMIFPVSVLLTLRILLAWLPYDFRVMAYLPSVFLGQLMMTLGVFYSLFDRK